MNRKNILLLMLMNCFLLIYYFSTKTKVVDTPIDNITLISMKNWITRFKDNKQILNLIKKALEDNVVMRSEYNAILKLVVEENQRRSESEKNETLKKMKEDLNIKSTP